MNPTFCRPIVHDLEASKIREVAVAGAGLDGIAEVRLEVVGCIGNRRDPALRVVGVGFRAVLLGDDGDGAVRSRF